MLSRSIVSGGVVVAGPSWCELVWVDGLVPDVCWRLLSRRVVGRVEFVRDGRPCVLSVNYGVVGDAIVFRAATDTSPNAADAP